MDLYPAGIKFHLARHIAGEPNKGISYLFSIYLADLDRQKRAYFSVSALLI